MLALFLLACAGRDVDSASPCAQDTSDWQSLGAALIVESGTAVIVEIPDGQPWRVLADGDCIEAEDDVTYCPVWDLSSYHQVVDGYLETVGSNIEGRVVNGTDRDWRVTLY